MQKYWNTVQDEQGRPRYGASVAVKQNGVNSSIFSTSTGTAKANPLTSDSTRGYFEFFAAAGAYDLVVSGVGFDSYTISSGAEIGLPSDDVTFTQSGIGAATNLTVQGELRKLVRASQFTGADFGVQLQAAHDALTSAGGIIDCSDITTTQSVATQVNISKPVRIVLGNATHNGPTTGFMFRNTSNDVSIEGSGATSLVQGAGSSGIIQNVDADRFHLRRLKIDMNNVANANGIHLLGGWYPQLDQVWSNKSTVAASSNDLRIESTAAGSGSRGVFIGDHQDCVFQRVKLIGVSGAQRVTVQTFTRLDTSFVIADWTLDTTFVGCAFQNSAGTMFTLNQVTGWTTLSNDIEGATSTVYAFGTAVRGVKSINNTISGASMTYTTGTLPAASYFMDDNEGVAITGQILGHCGSSEPLEFINAGWTDKHMVGISYSGDTFGMSANIKPISDTQGNLINTGSGGVLFQMKSSATWKLSYAIAGVNPRTFTDLLTGDSVGTVKAQRALMLAQGAAVASANNLVLGMDGNRFQISGATQINLLDNTNWQVGPVTLHFQSTPTVKHNQAASGNNKPIMLWGSVDFSAAANDRLTLQYDSTDSKWYEMGRTLVSGAITSATSDGVGYATGAGGTIAQSTDKTTGVTLSKATGLITMNGAVLNAATAVSFVLTNTAIAATDTIILNHASAGTAGAYTLYAQAAAGSATITVRNITAGNLSEAIVIRFTVIKSVSA